MVEDKDKGLLCYKTVMNSTNKYFHSIKEKKSEDYNIPVEKSNGGDLANMMSHRTYHEEETAIFKPKNIKAKDVETELKLDNGVVKKTNDENAPNLFMFSDSFTISLIPFLSEHFNIFIYY